MNVAYNNVGSGNGIFAPTPRRLGCPVEKVNPDRYMFAQHVTSLGGPVAAMPSGEMEASSAFYKREMFAPIMKETSVQPNQDDGIAFYFPQTSYDGALNEQADLFHPSASPWMDLQQTKLLHNTVTLPQSVATPVRIAAPTSNTAAPTSNSSAPAASSMKAESSTSDSVASTSNTTATLVPVVKSVAATISAALTGSHTAGISGDKRLEKANLGHQLFP